MTDVRLIGQFFEVSKYSLDGTIDEYECWRLLLVLNDSIHCMSKTVGTRQARTQRGTSMGSGGSMGVRRGRAPPRRGKVRISV